MASISYIKLWESDLNGVVTKKDKIQDLNINQLKLEVHDTYKKDEKTRKIQTTDDDVIKKSYLDEKIKK